MSRYFKKTLSLLMLFLIFFFQISLAADNDQNLSQVILNLNADKWIVSQTANVQISVYALLTESQLASAQENILNTLKNFSSEGDWHIVQMQRSKNQANLEQLEVTAEARLPNNQINNLRQKARASSKQGETYEVKDIDYSPSPEEIATAQFELRQKIYQSARDEVNSINQVFPNQRFSLFSINFNTSAIQPQAYLEKNTAFVESSVNSQPNPTPNTNIDVSQHLTLSAQVTLSSWFNAANKK